MNIKYPHIHVDLGNLAGPEGNAFCILGRVQAALRQAGIPQEEIDAYVTHATAGDYNHLLGVTEKTVNVS